MDHMMGRQTGDQSQLFYLFNLAWAAAQEPKKM
jgi:hypothetical protein